MRDQHPDLLAKLKWYNSASIQAKTTLVTKYHLAGLSMWSLGQEDQQFWQAATEGLP